MAKTDNVVGINAPAFPDPTLTPEGCMALMQWIPCSERLPEEDDTYLCVYRFPSSQKSRCTTMFFYATDPNPHFQYENYHGIKITHWLPTPPLPNQEIGEK